MHKHSHVHKIAINVNTTNVIDPTRTTMIRRAFMADAKRRFTRLMQIIRMALVDKDVLGLSEGPISSSLPLVGLEKKASHLRLITLSDRAGLTVREAAATIEGRAFAFQRSDKKIDSFMSWLDEMEQKTVLEITRRPGTIRGMEEAWTDTYIQSSYQKGIIQKRQELLKAGVDVTPLESAEGMMGAFNQPIHADRVGLLYTRTFNELKGVTKAMDQQISRILAQGMAEGRNPMIVAREISKDAVAKIGITRAKMIAQTEITRANGEAAIAEYKRAEATGIPIKAEWETGGSACPICAALSGRVFDLDDIQGIHPAHPNCLVSYEVPIFTSKGWMKIKDIKVGDLVLTHKGRFKKVTQLHRNSDQVDIVRFSLKGESNQKFSLSVTANHPILINGEWKVASLLRKGSTVHMLSSGCIRCGKPIPYFKKYCSASCNSKDITDRQWNNPEHRKNISEKAKMQMKTEYDLGLRDRYEITKGANERTRQLVKEGRWILQNTDVRDRGRHLANTPEHRKASSERMKKNNPMHNPKSVKKMQKSLNNLYELHPEKRLNVRLAKHCRNGNMTWIEKRMSLLLDKIGVEYIFQYPILRYNVDFVIPSLRIVVECDGEHWHRDKKADQKRQREIEKEGWFVLRYTGSKINTCLGEIEGELNKVFANHNGDYFFTGFKVKSIRRWKSPKKIGLYNLSVEKDESYIANGFIVHNCRCNILPVVGPDLAKAEKEGRVEGVRGKVVKPEVIKKTIDPVTLKKTIKEWKKSEGPISLTTKQINNLQAFALEKPKILYRGLRIESWDEKHNIFSKAKSGSTIELSSDQLASWTTSRATGEMFMVSNGSLPLLADEGLKKYSEFSPRTIRLVVEREFQPRQTVLDYNRWAKSYEDKGGDLGDFPMFGGEGEVIVKKGTYKVKIISKLRNGKLIRADDFSLD